MAVLALGCPAPSGEPPAAEPEAAAPVEESGDEGGSGDAEGGPWSLRGPIQELHARNAEAPGRTGILAERRRYSLFDEELIIRDFFQDRRGGFFVDVGCAWPARANNTYYLEKHLDWSGIGIDALEDYAEGWARLRPRSRFFAYLVTDHSGSDDVFFKSERMGLSSTRPARAKGRQFGGDLEIEQIRVPSITLDALLESEGVERIDLLAMDIEGHELTALHGIDLGRFRPELIVVEGRREDVKTYLEGQGYERIERYLPFDQVNSYYQRRAPAS